MIEPLGNDPRFGQEAFAFYFVCYLQGRTYQFGGLAAKTKALNYAHMHAAATLTNSQNSTAGCKFEAAGGNETYFAPRRGIAIVPVALRVIAPPAASI